LIDEIDISEFVYSDTGGTRSDDRPGDWRVSIADSRADDSWEMKILGPNGFERSYTLGEVRESTNIW
jgi:hypothetical protein